jgi:GR25 family glycosyltransferase involved in LPS biosynthesis
MSTQPPIYVINLAKDTARMASMAAQLSAQGLVFERVEAVVGTDITAVQRRAVYSGFWFRVFHGRNATSNELGCTLSHRKAWQLMLDRGQDWAVFFEDDVLFAETFSSELFSIELATRDYDMVQFHSFETPEYFVEQCEAISFKIGLYRGSHASAAAYILRSAGAQKMLKGGRVWINADKWVWATALYGLTCCAIYPFLISPREELSMTSSIGLGRKNSFIYRWTLLPILRVVRLAIIKLRDV